MDDAQPERAAVDPFLGRTLEGKYLVEELLGWGAMGSVYRARQVALERTVALKVMSPELAKDPDFVARFHREAKTASRLWHPNTVSVTDFGEAADGLLYLVMELVPGCNLDEIIQQEFPLGDARVVSIVSQLLSAVAAAHDLGIIHRDLKPENLLVVRGVDDEGAPLDTVKVCDFGLARGLGAEVEEVRTPSTITFGPKLTSVGLVLGTPAYMSPEQAAGLAPDRRSDLYAVGAILFELLTREVPFDRETAQEMVLAHISDAPRDPRDLVRDCNPALAAICLRALAKEPTARPQTARAMRAAVQRALVYPDETTFPSLDDPRAPESAYPSSTLRRTNRSSEIRSAKPPSTRTTASEAPVVDPVIVVPPRRRWPIVAVLGVISVASAGYAGAHWRSDPIAMPVPTVLAPSSIATTMPPAPVSVLAPIAAAAAPAGSAVVPSDVRKVHGPVAKVPATSSVAPPPVTAEPEPPPPTIEAPAPVPPVAVAAAVPASPVVAAPPPYSADHATVAISVSEVSGTSRGTVGALVAHVALTDCYQNALRTLGRPEGGQGTIHVDFDEDGVITSSSVKLPPALVAATACFRSRMQRQRLGRPPDTGSASGDLVIKLTP